MDSERKHPGADPPAYAAGFDARDSDEARDSSAGRAVTDPAIRHLGSGGATFLGTREGARVRLVHRTGASAEIHLLGATITSCVWTPPSFFPFFFFYTSNRITFEK
jgi:hypothetical protein